MPRELRQPALIVICGWPVSGKTTIAKALEQQLGIHRVDIDEVRRVCTGVPHQHPDKSSELMEQDKQEMRMAYHTMYFIADLNLSVGRSLIMTATMSRKSYWTDFQVRVLGKHQNVTVKVVQCLPRNDPQEEIEHRLNRGFGDKHFGAVNSYKRYLEVKNRYEAIETPHLEIDTAPPNTEENCTEQALVYVLS